jgi:hypothetical protein
MEDIRDWLNSKRDYNTGVQIFLQHSKDGLLRRLFTQEGFSDYKQKKLVSLMEGLLINKPKPTAKEMLLAAKELPPPEKKKEPAWSSTRDDVEQSLYLQWREKYSEMVNLQARVGDISKEATKSKDKSKMDEAGRMALRILDLDDECDDLFWRRDFYKKNGRLPEDEAPMVIAIDASLWYKKLHNHQRYARKFRHIITKDPSNTTAAALLQKHEWAVSEYKKLLKMDA